MHQEQINIIQTQRFQTLVEPELDAGIVCRPDLGHDKDVLPLDARGEGLLETLAHLVLVAVAVGGVDEPVAALEGVGYGVLNFALFSLPCAYTISVYQALI